MRRRVFLLAAEYSANPRFLPPARRGRPWLGEPHPDLAPEEVSRLFFRFPNKSEDGRTNPEDWHREFGLESPIGLSDLFASAGHRALVSLHRLQGGAYRDARDAITGLYVTSMPGLDPDERMNIGLVPQSLRALLNLSPRVTAQFVVGTSDSGAWAFAQAVRAARNAEKPATIVVIAGQIIPSGYASQYQIRTVLGGTDQSRGLDMLAVGDLLMDGARRHLGIPADELRRFLKRVAERKYRAGARYPAGIQAGRAFKRMAPRTPWFDATDIAAPCCGAAATIITSDEGLAQRIAEARLPRYGAAPVTEVLGVGEGSSNENLLHRQSPMLFATAVREALAATADDARLPLSAFASSAFGVLHDAFPSIELSFLLGMGLSWERAAERMASGWSNPFGGLVSFGHAIGASGLVQVTKAHHLFSGDQRYLSDQGARAGFRESGSVAFTTSVGGPLSHIVGGLFRGGFEQMRPFRERSLARTRPDDAGDQLTSEWREKRHQLRLALPSHLASLVPQVEGEPWLIEGTTYVSLRSALRALSAADVDKLTFDGLEELVRAEHLDRVRDELRTVMHVVLGEAGRAPSMFNVFRLLSDEVRDLALAFRAAGLVTEKALAMPEGKLAERVKEALRVPLAIVSTPGDQPAKRRRVVFLPESGLTFASLAEVDLLAAAPDGTLAPVPPDTALLPFWNSRATRPAATARTLPEGGPSELVDEILRRGVDTFAEVRLLRSWFAAATLPAALEQDAGAAGLGPARPPASVRTVVYCASLAARGRFESQPGAAHELLGRAVREARAFLDASETTLAQVGEALFVIAWERPPFRAGPEGGLLAAARFAREIAQATAEHGVVVRAAICPGAGELFADADGRPAVTTPASARALALAGELDGGAAIAFEGDADGLPARLAQKLTGWREERSASPGVILFRPAP